MNRSVQKFDRNTQYENSNPYLATTLYRQKHENWTRKLRIATTLTYGFNKNGWWFSNCYKSRFKIMSISSLIHIQINSSLIPRKMCASATCFVYKRIISDLWNKLKRPKKVRSLKTMRTLKIPKSSVVKLRSKVK